MSNLVEHARRELALVGEDGDTIDGIARVVQAFADCGHSGGSAPYAIAYLERLLRFQPLSPLSNDPAEWEDRSEISGYPIWQSTRDPEAMSHDGGQTYWRTSEAEAAGSSEAAPLHRSEPAKEVGGHFYGNHAFDDHAAAEGLCTHIDCPCRAYTPDGPLETDHRARIREVLDGTYGIDPATEIRHEAAVAGLVDLFRDLTRGLSEEVARLRLADADRAARELGVVNETPSGALINGRVWTHAQMRAAAMIVDDLPESYKRLLFGGALPTRPSPDAVSTPSPVPASEDAREGGGETHSGAEGSETFGGQFGGDS